MLRDIKTKKVMGPLADQADLWRAYQEVALDAPDVALQLPTGGGKTLVGVGLAEWRRLKFNERVLILCPTKQLVHQVANQSNELYGIRVLEFTGSKSDYDAESIAQYQNCERIGVTNYSSLFNIAPFFRDPQILVLDDAHAAEQFIAAMWSLQVSRADEEHIPLYDALVSALKPHITSSDHMRLATPERWVTDRNWVEKIPGPNFGKLSQELLAILDAHYRNSSQHRFVWPVIRDHLTACHLYLSAGSLLIRPLLPPTETHRPFSAAKQRIYMSATLGEAGELERITGRSNILRLKGKASWDKQAIGRRYFLFPERSLDETQQRLLTARLMKRAGRSLVLTPDFRRAEAFKAFIEQSLGFPVLKATDIESTKADFVDRKEAVAIVANRYDGIDFPGDECRLLIVEGLPRATNLQEQFLISKMGAVDLLDVRITTRLVQAFGRCTRSDQDYSAIMILGEELYKHLMTPARRMLLHPELHAEILFGIDQAKGTSVEGYAENFDAFLTQSGDWREAEADILASRDELRQEAPRGASSLAAAAPHELEYQLALWNGDFERALEMARKVLTVLIDPELRGYRALWHYLAGSAAWHAHRTGSSGLDIQAREQFLAAIKAERYLHWLVPLSKLAGRDEARSTDNSFDVASLTLVERIESLFVRLGTLHDFKFDPFESEVRTDILKNDAKAFERGQRNLGELLGYEGGISTSTGAPDPWWLAGEEICFVFEDHSDADPATSLSVRKARQAASHPNWIRANVPAASEARIYAVLVTPVRRLDVDAAPQMKDVLVWNLDRYREWAANAISTVRELRRSFPAVGDLAWRAEAAQKLAAAKVTPNTLLEYLLNETSSNPLIVPES